MLIKRAGDEPMKTLIDPPEFEKLNRVLANEKRILVADLAAVMVLAVGLLAVLLSAL
jgi:hypothetical protein